MSIINNNCNEKLLLKSKDKNDLVSCVIPSYRRSDTVARAIDSVLSQTYPNIEVCLVDDNIPGDEYSLKLQKVLKKYEGDKRVRYITQVAHVNGAVARNVGIQAAKGKYIAFLDDDDEWMPEKIEKQIEQLRKDNSLDGVTVLWTLYINNKLVRKCPIYNSEKLQLKILRREVAVFTSTVFIKKEVIKEFGGFNEKLIRHQDLQFLVDALAISKFYVIPEYLIKMHGDSVINHPDLDKTIKIKNDFLKTIQGELNKYNTSEQKRIINAHYFEIVFCALKSKNLKVAMEYILKIGFNLMSFKDLLKRFRERYN